MGKDLQSNVLGLMKVLNQQSPGDGEEEENLHLYIR
jgi:hypothetical protein